MSEGGIENFDLKFEDYHDISLMYKAILKLTNKQTKTKKHSSIITSTFNTETCIRASPESLQCAKSFLFF